ncbi:SdpI family protein [Croceimicrobium hydrocarbonivorans]|uniref:SdpI family protein n=1 Tax=Croceimicrobium hydrocarbonivorans TaxID=2761580 RepID=A0A7H0VF61_9FLAO|nr:SdpI family protein [Croceimicrobium hydrocarbonivorans]QNR24359.1 SdpI family protein [Croceimicrobium hydrocarbonivorans]
MRIDIVFLIFLGFAVLMWLVALITKLFPARKPNSLYGYRTDRSMRNRRNWNYAQSLLPKMFFRVGLYHILLAALWSVLPPLNDSMGIMLFGLVLIAAFGLELYRSEYKLKKYSKERF